MELERLAVRVLLWDEEEIRILLLAIMISGAVLAAIGSTIKVSIGRVAYLWFIVASHSAVAFLTAWLSNVPAAANAGLLFPMLMMYALGMMTLGAFLYVGSAARSNDIWGTTKRWWVGFVPLINLVMLFRGPATPRKLEPASSVVNVLLVVVALSVFSINSGWMRSYEGKPLYDVADSPTLQRLLRQEASLETLFQWTEDEVRASLPAQLDEITRLISISAEGKALRLTYQVSSPNHGLGEEHRRSLQAQHCSADAWDVEIARGATIFSDYRYPDGELIVSYKTDAATCP